MFYKLFLPQPSQNLIDKVRERALLEPINYSSAKWHKEFQGGTINCASGTFFTDETITKLVRLEFQKYFKKEIYPIIGILKNIDPLSSSAYPPHIDRSRSMAINYYIESGGDEVETVFYKFKDPHRTFGEIKVAKYADIIPLTKVQFNSNTWYALDVTKIHSVENITAMRLMLALSFSKENINHLREILDANVNFTDDF